MAEKIYKIVNNALQEIPQRDPTRRYRYKLVNGENAYVEFTDAEETARTAEEAIVPPYLGPFRIVATRATQTIPNNTPTPIDFDTEAVDLGGLHSTSANLDRFVVPTLGDGLYLINAWVKFNESSAAGGGTANAGDRIAQIRQGGAALVSQRMRASAASDSEIVLSTEVDLVAADVVRIGCAHSNGGTLTVTARMTMRRV